MDLRLRNLHSMGRPHPDTMEAEIVQLLQVVPPSQRSPRSQEPAFATGMVCRNEAYAEQYQSSNSPPPGGAAIAGGGKALAKLCISRNSLIQLVSAAALPAHADVQHSICGYVADSKSSLVQLVSAVDCELALTHNGSICSCVAF